MGKELPKLVMASDMAEMWGVSRKVVNNWTKRDPQFPKPVMVVNCGRFPLYLEEQAIQYGISKGIQKNSEKQD